MPTDYPGNPTNIADQTATAFVTEPAGSDQRNAASVRTTFQQATDWLESFRQRLIGGISGDDNPSITFTQSISARKRWADFTIAGVHCRIYFSTALEIAFNAKWNYTGGNANKWTQDDAASVSLRLGLFLDGFRIHGQLAGASAWTNGSWIEGIGFDLAALTSRILRLSTTGTAFNSANFTITDWGSGATISAVSGNDNNCTFEITAGTTPTAQPAVTVAYQTVWTLAPTAIFQLRDTDDDTIYGKAIKVTPGTANVVAKIDPALAGTWTPTATKKYRFSMMMMGRD